MLRAQKVCSIFVSEIKYKSARVGAGRFISKIKCKSAGAGSGQAVVCSVPEGEGADDLWRWIEEQSGVRRRK